MKEPMNLRSETPRPHLAAPRAPARSEMNYREGRPDLPLYDVLECLHEAPDETDDSPDPSAGLPRTALKSRLD